MCGSNFVRLKGASVGIGVGDGGSSSATGTFTNCTFTSNVLVIRRYSHLQGTCKHLTVACVCVCVCGFDSYVLRVYFPGCKSCGACE